MQQGKQERQRWNAEEGEAFLLMAITKYKGERNRLSKGNIGKVSNKLKQMEKLKGKKYNKQRTLIGRRDPGYVKNSQTYHTLMLHEHSSTEILKCNGC